jgi:asparagine synthase (glutamine-hydrolysing)
MCGITGFIQVGKADYNINEVMMKMTSSLSHRGPNDYGIEIIPIENEKTTIGFGHRRLSIIDLTRNGHQPMWDRKKELCIVLNGEIYNYVELREELLQKGYEFISKSDTEVLIYAYKEWGTECFRKLNGMWAIAIFDKKKKNILLSRDRYGKKPLYYYISANGFIFASEIKALLLHPSVVKLPNYEKVFRYLSLNYRYLDIDNESFFQNILQVPPSTFMEINTALTTRTMRYWELSPITISENKAESKIIEEFRDLLIDAIKIRLRSDVPVGCMLSGGMDSTSITAIAYKILKTPVTTFSGITGKEKGVYDESEYIDSVIKDTSADFHYIRPDPSDIFDTVSEMLAFHDEPICTVTWYSLYLIAKKIREENVPVVLNGHGGDELLAGYWDHYHYYLYELSAAGKVHELENEISFWKKNHKRDPEELTRMNIYIKKMLGHEIGEMSRFDDYSQCFHPDVVSKYKRDIQLTNNMTSLLSKRLYSELFYETVPATLRPEDRNTMSQSIESRSPFLDYRLAEFTFSLDNKYKIRNGLGKWILRESMKGILPEKVRTRTDKAGFIAPADLWFKTVNKNQIQDMINSTELGKENIFDIGHIQKIFDEHCEGKANHHMFLWRLINLYLWYKRFFSG